LTTVGKNQKVATQLAPNCWPTCASQGKLVKVHNSIKGTQIETQTLAGGTPNLVRSSLPSYQSQ